MTDINDVPLIDLQADADVPLAQGSFNITIRPKQIDDMYRGHAAALKSEVEGKSVFEAYDEVDASSDPRAEVNVLAAQRSSYTQESLTRYFNNNLGESPEDVATNVQVYQEMMADEQAKASSVERQTVESIAGVTPDETELQRAQAELELVNVVSDIVKDYTTLEKVIDIGKSFLPTGLLDNKQATDTFFNAEAFMRDIVIGMKDLRRNEPEKFKRILPVLVEELEEDLPKSKQLTVLTAILAPRGEEELDDFSAINAAIDTLDLATMGMVAAAKVAKVVKSLNSIKLARKLDNIELASEVNTASLIDGTGEVATKAGIDNITAHANAAPFGVEDLDDAYASGLSSETISNIAAVKAKQRKVSEIIRSGDGLLRENLLTPAERLVAEEKFSEMLRSEGIDDFVISARTEDTTTFNYNVLSAESEPTQITRTFDLTLDDVTSTWKNTEKGMTAAWLKSPTAFANWAKDDVRSAVRLDSTSANVGELFKTLQADAMKPLIGKSGLRAFSPKARKELAELDDVLRAGDEWKDPAGIRGKMFTPDELRGGLVNGITLNDRQIETYYNMRGLYDELWTIRNDEARRTLSAQGKREVGVAGEAQVGKPYTREGAVGSLNTSGGSLKVYNATTDEVLQVSSKDIASLYDDGLVLSRLENETKIPTGEHGEALYDLVLTNKDAIQDLPQRVLSYREGYVPKVNVGAYWFIKTTGTKVVNGQTMPNQILKTERMFSSQSEAKKWMDGLTKGLKGDELKAAQAAKDKMVLLPDRALEQQVMGSSQIGSGGGLYTGTRAFDDLPFGADGVSGERLNTYEALGQNLQSLENYVTRNQWRMGMRQRWINSAKAAGFPVDRFEKVLIPEGDPRGVGLRKMAEQIEVWSGFPTSSELRWDGFVSGVMEWALNSRLVPFKDKSVVRAANYLRHQNNNPVNVMRNTAFHTLLGVMNPAQLWVQAQGAAIAASLSNSPMKAFRLQNALATAAHFGGDSAVTRTIAKATGTNAEELIQLTKLWNKTGLESSISNTADLAAASKGIGVGREALRRVSDKGLLFYRMGELFNRRYSFIVAAQRKHKKVGNYNFNDTQLKDVLTDANNMMLNLSRANQAAWQRGVVAIPTQFLQVQAKFLETLSGSNKSFTIRERGRILAGQVALYGAAGIPLGNMGVRWAQESLGFSQQDIETLDPTVVEAINNGMWGVFAHNWLGADVDMSNRGAIANGMMEFTLDLMFSEAHLGEKVVGAFGTVPHRAFNAWGQIKPMILNEREDDLTSAEIMRGLSAVASITSTWNNVQKGYFMNRFHQLNDSRGNPVVANEDFALETEVMTMLGFQPSELKRVRDRETLLRSRKEYRAQVTDSLVDHYWNYVQALKGVENEDERNKVIDHYTLGTQVLLKSLKEGERQQVRAALNTRLENLEDKKTRVIRQYLEEFSDGQVLEMGSIIASMRANGLIQNELEFPEEGKE